MGTDRVVTSIGLTHRVETSEKSWGSLFPADEERENSGRRKGRQDRFLEYAGKLGLMVASSNKR
jgi:hypothetical protein